MNEVKSIVIPSNLTVGYSNRSTDSVSVDLTPDTMTVDVTLIDTGDGTSWIKISNGGTYASSLTGINGDFTLYAKAQSYNGSFIRSCKVKVTDTTDSTVYDEVVISQMAQPI